MIFFKYFYLMLTPIKLNIDGNFFDEMYKFCSDIMSHTKKYKDQKKLQFYDKNINEIDTIKKAFDDLKKPYDI